MSADQERRLEEVFDAACALSPEARAAFLDQACAGHTAWRQEVESLLAAHERAGGFMNATAASPTLPPTEQAGTRIGRYKLLEQMGEGGFGVVWMAEQEKPVRRRVALKIIKLGMDTKEVVARFDAERQALAMMDHPNIASVFDGGATDTGRPYFVMEVVNGVPITDYCDANQLSTRQRLDLFMQVCQAVQHAHQKGVIHRDLKPSNILVTVKDDRPVPKVIDFGVAKATQARLTDKTLFTRFQQWIGTPAYMSPEQAGLGSLDVDTRSDIYSLGVLLYELLTGRTPFDTQKLLATGYDVVMRTIREEEPPTPSTRLSTLAAEELNAVAAKRGAEPAKLNRLVRGDLDWIVMKALEKDRARRYETANGLAADLQRHLGNEPVTAVAPTLGYQLLKFARRQRGALATGCALLIVLATGAGISLVEAGRASREARAAARLVTRQYEREGIRLLNDGDLTGSLVYFTEALQRDEADSDRCWLHRLRIALVLGQCPELKALLVHDANVITARFTADGREIVSAANKSQDATRVRVWEAAGLKPVATNLVETERERVILSPGAGWIATYDQVGLKRAHTIKLWNARRPTPPLTLFSNSWVDLGPSLRNPRNAVLGFSRDDRRVVLAHKKEVRVWDMARGKGVSALTNLTTEVVYAALSADGMKLALCVEGSKTNSGAKGEVQLRNAETMESIAPPLIHTGLPIFAGFDAAGQRLVTASVCSERPLLNILTNWDYTTGEAQVWDARSGEPVTPPLRHDQPAYQAELSPDGRTLVTVSGNPKKLLREEIGDAQMHFWDLSSKASPERLHTIPLAGFVTATFAADGQRVLAGRHYEVMEPWWNLKGRHPPDGEGFSLVPGGPASGVFRLKFPHTDFFVCFSPDGHRCLVSNKGRALQVWQLRAGDSWTSQPLAGEAIEPERRKPESEDPGVAAFSPDARRAVVKSGRNRFRIRDFESGQPLTPQVPLEGALLSAEFSLDGKLLLTLSQREQGNNDSNVLQLWDAERGDPLSPPLPVSFGSCSFGGRDPVAVVTNDGGRRSLALSPDQRPVLQLVRLAQWLAGRSLDASGALTELDAEAWRALGNQVRDRSAK